MRANVCVLLLTSMLALTAGRISSVFEWRFIDYTWPSPTYKLNITLFGQYNSSNIIPADVDRDADGRVFVSFLGISGAPVTLGIVSKSWGPGGPLIQPYPNWSWFTPDSCESLQSVYRIAIDKCNRLWVLDTGYKDGEKKTCLPQLVIFDLRTDSHIQTIKIPRKFAVGKNGETLLANPIIDTEEPRCKKTIVYIADVFGNGLVILNNGSFYRYEHPTFQPDNNTSESGILGLAITPRLFPWERKYLFYRPLNSHRLFSVNVDGFRRNGTIDEMYLESSGDVLLSSAFAMAFSSEGTLFFGLSEENAIGCWNRYRSPLVHKHIGIVDLDSERLRHLNGVKVIKPSRGHPKEELWVLSNRYREFRAGTLQKNDVNFRILKGSVQSLVEDSICDLPNRIRLKLH